MTPVVKVDRLLVYIPGIVGVYRTCNVCGRLFRNNRWLHRKCEECRQPVSRTDYGPARGIALTDKGRAMCAQLRAEDAA